MRPVAGHSESYGAKHRLKASEFVLIEKRSRKVDDADILAPEHLERSFAKSIPH